MEGLDSAKDFAAQLTPLQIGVGVALLVFLAIGLRLILKKPPAHLTAFSGDSGSVLVSRKALQELVKSACLLDEWVEAARPVIRVKDNVVAARVELRLASPDNLKAVCERVQDHITALLRRSLSFEQIGSIEIVVKSFGNEHPQAASEAEPATLLPTPKSNADAPETAEEPQAEDDSSIESESSASGEKPDTSPKGN